MIRTPKYGTLFLGNPHIGFRGAGFVFEDLSSWRVVAFWGGRRLQVMVREVLALSNLRRAGLFLLKVSRDEAPTLGLGLGFNPLGPRLSNHGCKDFGVILGFGARGAPTQGRARLFLLTSRIPSGGKRSGTRQNKQGTTSKARRVHVSNWYILWP